MGPSQAAPDWSRTPVYDGARVPRSVHAGAPDFRCHRWDPHVRQNEHTCAVVAPTPPGTQRLEATPVSNRSSRLFTSQGVTPSLHQSSSVPPTGRGGQVRGRRSLLTEAPRRRTNQTRGGVSHLLPPEPYNMVASSSSSPETGPTFPTPQQRVIPHGATGACSPPAGARSACDVCGKGCHRVGAR